MATKDELNYAERLRKESEQRVKILEMEEKIQRNLARQLQDNMKSEDTKTRLAAKRVAQITEGLSLEEQLLAVSKQKEVMEKRIAKTGDKSAKVLLKLFEEYETNLGVSKEQRDLIQEQYDLQKKQSDELKEALGYNQEIADLFAAGGVMALGAKAFTDGISAAGDAFTETFDTAKDLYKTTGLTANESAQLAANAQFAAMSFNPFAISQEEAASATTALVDRLGSAQQVTSALIEDAAEIGNLTGDAASGADLALIFEQASGDAGALADDIKEIASDSGVAASKVFAQLADQQAMLLNMSEEEIKVLAEKTAELTKQGLSMDKLRGISDSMLDIEGSIQKQMKARAFGLGEMLPDQQAMRDAAMEMQYGDATKGAEMMAAALKESGMNAEEFGKMGFKQQQIYAEAIGMSRDELQNQLITQQKNEEMVGKYGKTGAEVMGFISAGAASAASGAKELVIQFVKIAAQAMIMNKVMTGKSGFGNLFGGGGKGPDTGKMTKPVKDATNMDTPDPKKSAGIKGFLKGLKSGLQSFAKGAGKTLLGAAVLAGVVAILGVGFKVAMEIIGDVDPMKMMAFSLGIGILGASLALMGAIGGNVIMGALALSIVAVALIPAAFAFSLLENVDIGKMIAFSIMLPLLALAAAGLGFIAPFVMAGAAALLVLGLAIIPAAMAFGMLSDANMEGIVDKLATLGQVAGPLLMVGAGLVSIAAGLAMMGYMGMGALPILGMLLALSAAAPALLAMGSMFGLGGGDDSGVEEKDPINYDKLATALASQPLQVVIDGKVVSEISRVQNVRQSKKY